MNIQEYLREHPLPWRVEQRPGGIYADIYDAKGNETQDVLQSRFAEFVVERVNSGPNAAVADTIARKDALLAEAAGKIDELRAECDRLQAKFLQSQGHHMEVSNRLLAVVAEHEALKAELEQLRNIVDTQAELITRQHIYTKQLEARA